MATKTMKWKNPHGLLPPKPIKHEGGNKVGWNTYATIEEAELCSRWAQEEASHKAELGYDFGYQCPGSVTPVKGVGFVVCVP